MKPTKYALPLLLVVIVAVLAVGSASPAFSYRSWDTGCTDCHTSFTGDESTKPGNVWPEDKHVVHRSAMMDQDVPDSCGACHDQIGDDPLLNSSAGTAELPGLGCMGCHGVDPTPGTENNLWGAGLRLHHANANVGGDGNGLECVTCHPVDPLPMPEDILPAYYGLPTINVLDPCNPGGTENWTSDGLGLDNDGDLDYDADDSACTSIFADGFESDDTSAWSSTVP